MLLTKIKIHELTYVVALFSFLSGYFEFMILLIISILIHELGHASMASILKEKVDKIIIFPFGGITKVDSLINCSLKNEFLILISGPIIQSLFMFLIIYLNKINLVPENTYDIFIKINVLLLSFNLLPLLPLDGGRLLNLFLEKIFPFKLSHKISLIISFITIILVTILMLIYDIKILYILLFLIILKNLINECLMHNVLYKKFLLERLIYDFKFKKTLIIKNIKNMKRGKKHKISFNNTLYPEKYFISKAL